MVVLGRNMFKGIYKADIGLDCQFVPLGQIVWSEIRQAGFQRQSTGLSHLDGFESFLYRPPKKKNHTERCGFFFGGRYRTRTYDLPHVKRML